MSSGNLRARGVRPLLRLRAWIDSHALPRVSDSGPLDDRIDPWRVLPFIALHVACLGVLWVGWSVAAVLTCAALYGIRMVAITGFYHRYFAHRAFKAGRFTQFVLAVLGASAAQRGPLWWASHHRHHHAHSDTPEDVHAPSQRGFLWSHMGWFLSSRNFATRTELIGDFARYRELRWLDRFDIAVPLILALILYGAGTWLAVRHPHLGTNGAQLVVWGFVVSTVLLYHVTFCVNSLAHRFGSRRYPTHDHSRNSAWLALLTFGEGWHNNHHRFPGSARQGLRWWEIDITWYVLRLMAMAGVIDGLRTVPASTRPGSPPQELA